MTIFIKPFRVKSNTQMKGSDKKKLKAALKKSFSKLSDDDLNQLLPAKEEIVVSKIFTFNEESVLLYIHNKNTVFFEMEKDKIFFPSIYTLWKYPEVGADHKPRTHDHVLLLDDTLPDHLAPSHVQDS